MFLTSARTRPAGFKSKLEASLGLEEVVICGSRLQSKIFLVSDEIRLADR